ncbi:MAG: ABC transporter ATP-binding protein [Armatimonadetes bacterium]|nr:ABC transporter ATP-binding protein [Armatimonadota bacterium]
MQPPPSPPPDDKPLSVFGRLRFVVGEARKVIVSVPRAFHLVWDAGPGLTSALLVLNVVSALFPAAVLWFTKLVIDSITHLAATGATAADSRRLTHLILYLAGLWVLQGGLGAFSNALTGILRFQVEQHTQILIMRKCGELDIVFFENPKNLDMLENATRGAMMSAWTLVWMLFSLVQTLITLLTFIGLLVRLSWVAALVVAVTTAPQMVASSYFARRRWAMNTARAEDSRLRFYLTWLTGQRDPAKEIRVFGLLEAFLERFRFYCRKFFLQERGLEGRRETVNFVLSFLGNAGAAGIWIYVALRAVARVLSMGDVVLYTQAVSAARGSLVSIFTQGGQLYEQTLFLGNLFTLLDLDPLSIDGALRPPEGSTERWGTRQVPAELTEGIEFRHVSFRYPGTDHDVLKDVSFRLRPAESVALVGRNGAGKTTVVKLLARLYDPIEGQILLEGRELREYDIKALRQCFGVIFQDFVRYALTARENIGFGQVERVNDLPRVQQAAGKAGADEVIERLPNQYECYLGRQFMGLGEDLSGGEWQKLALARAYMRESPILILDEPTASLDAFAEYEVYKSFEEMTAGRMSVFISHRFSTVRVAKHILVLDEGGLVDEGTHDDLMARDGLYAAMFNVQAERYR